MYEEYGCGRCLSGSSRCYQTLVQPAPHDLLSIMQCIVEGNETLMRHINIQYKVVIIVGKKGKVLKYNDCYNESMLKYIRINISL